MRNVFVAAAIVIFCGSCFKNGGCGYSTDNTEAPLAEQQLVKHYLDSAHVSATLNPHGFYYSIVSAGVGASPGPCSPITVTYKGQLTNGSVFDQEVNMVFNSLGSLIDGWREGIPLIAKGGEIILYIPPSLGYGLKTITDNSGNVVVPPDSILIFDISLTDVE